MDEIIDSIIALIRSYNLNPGIANSLITKLQNAEASISKGNYTAAANQLGAFLNEVAAKSGKQLTAAQAADLTARVNGVIAALP